MAQITFNGTHARQGMRRLNKADRQMATCLWSLGRGLRVGVVLTADRVLDQLKDRGATFTQQHVVEIGAGCLRHGNAHLAPLKLQLGGGGFRGTQPSAGGIVVGQDDNAPCLGGQLRLFHAAGGKCCPDRQGRTGAHHGKASFDTFTKAKQALCGDRAKPHRAAGGLAEHHARLCEGRLGHLVWLFRKIGPVQRDHFTSDVANEPDHGGIAGAGFVMRQVGVKQQIRIGRDKQAATFKVALRCCALDGCCVVTNKGDVQRCIAFRLWRCWRFLPLGAFALPAGDASRMGE